MNEDFINFGKQILISWIANQLPGLKLFNKKNIEESSEIKNELLENNQKVINGNITPQPTIKYKTYDIMFYLESFLEKVKEPVIYLLIESSFSGGAYNLICSIIESRITGEWYVFHRGRISLQGSGGGISNTKSIVALLKKRDIPISVWYFDKEKIDLLEKGEINWLKIKNDGIPLTSLSLDESNWKEIKKNAEKLLEQ